MLKKTNFLIALSLIFLPGLVPLAQASDWSKHSASDEEIGRIGSVTNSVQIEGEQYTLSVTCIEQDDALFLETSWGNLALDRVAYVSTDVVLDEGKIDEENWLSFQNSVPIGTSKLVHELPSYLLRWMIKGSTIDLTMVYAVNEDDNVSYIEREFSLIGFTAKYSQACSWHPLFDSWKL